MPTGEIMYALFSALFTLLFTYQAQAGEYQVPYAFQLAVGEDGVPLLQYENQEKGGILVFKLSPMFKDPEAKPAPMVDRLKVRVHHSSVLVGDSRCSADINYQAFCQVILTRVGERVLLRSLNQGMLALGLSIIVKPGLEVDPTTPQGSSVSIDASVQHNYFIQNPIPIP
jgi:hypothetical protein